MSQGMVRKQIYLTAPQNERLRRAAKRLRRSEADLLREAVDRHLAGEEAVVPSVDEDSLFTLIGAGKGAPKNLSESVDQILYGRRRRS